MTREVTRREVTHHRSGQADLHQNIVIMAGEPGLGGASTEYSVRMKDGDMGFDIARLTFQTKCVETPDQIDGLTNETLLAIVQDRLEGFQAGKYPCPENESALVNVKMALHQLHQRTHRRIASGLHNKKAEAPMSRVTKTEEALVIKGDGVEETIPLKSLEAWGGWPRVETAAKTLVSKGRPLSKEEMEVIESCAVGRGGKSGFAEFAQAYRQHVGS